MFFWTELFNCDTDETDSFSSNFRNILSITNIHFIDKSSSRKSRKERFSRCLAVFLPVVLFPGRNRRRSPKNGALPSFQPIREHFTGKKSRRNQFLLFILFYLCPFARFWQTDWQEATRLAENSVEGNYVDEPEELRRWKKRTLLEEDYMCSFSASRGRF